MKNVVLLAPYFLPRRRVGSWRPFKFAIHLREFGWQPHIITIRDSRGTLTPKEKALLQGISIYEVSPPFDFTGSSGSQLSESSKTHHKSLNLLQPISNWVDKQFPVDTWLPLFYLRKRQIIKHIKRIHPAVIWSTGDPWSSHWLAKKVAQAINVPWVADFRDPWTLGEMNLKKRSSFSSAVDKRIEQQVIETADRIIFTSKTTERLYKSHYEKQFAKMSTIYNSFDEELYSSPKDNSPSFKSEQLNLLFFGKFRRLSPAKPFINILAKLKSVDEEAASTIIMHSFGPLSDSDRRYARERGVFTQFKALQPIPAEQMLSVLPQSDILWLSTALERRHIIPAKLWDYLAARRPILSIAPNPEIGKIIDETGAGIQLNIADIDTLSDLLQQCVHAKKAGKKLPIPFSVNKEAVNHFEAKSATRTLAQTFDQLL